MPNIKIRRSSKIVRSGRVMQMEGLFAVPPNGVSEIEWEINLPIEQRPWNVGLIVGASGSGKTTLARELFADSMVSGYQWSQEKAILDGFPPTMPVKEVVEILNSVGFSDPPSWLRSFGVLSNGEQFRVTIARAIAETEKLFVVDEFTSVVDRRVAQIGSCAIARSVRKRGIRFVGVSCHYDIIEWLQPDWIYEPGTDSFQWRELQRRPAIELTIRRVHKDAWVLFRHHHYLDTDLSPSAQCFCAFINSIPVAFVAALPFPHATSPGWRLHRLVCLPDYQGVGIGVALADTVSSFYRGTGRPVYRTAGHPAVIAHCAKSKLWRMNRKPGRTAEGGVNSHAGLNKTHASNRITAGFEFIGEGNQLAAQMFGLKQY